MSKFPLLKSRVLVVEDEYLLAYQLAHALEDLGAQILGPVPSVKEALALIEAEGQIDSAVLDVNLDGEMVFPVAEALEARNIGFVFTTGYEPLAIPERYQHVPRCEKPVAPQAIVLALGRSAVSPRS